MTFTVIANSDLSPLDAWDLSVFGHDAKTVIAAPWEFSEEQLLVGRQASRRSLARSFQVLQACRQGDR